MKTVDMDYPSLKRLYSAARILSIVEEGNSLTDIQHATKLSFQTVMKTVSYLESLGLLSTRIVNRQRGRTREIVHISEDHKEISDFFEKILHKFDSAINTQDMDKCSSLLFEAQLLAKAEVEVKNCLNYQLFPEAGELFWQWVQGGEIATLVEDSISEEKKTLISDVAEIGEKGCLFSMNSFSLHVDLDLGEPKTPKRAETKATG